MPLVPGAATAARSEPGFGAQMRRGAALLSLLLLAALLAFFACRHEEPEARPLRLLELAARAEVEWPADPGPSPAAVSASDLGGGGVAGRVARMALTDGVGGRDDRAVLLAPAGARHRFRLRLPESPVLRTALGVVSPGESQGESPGESEGETGGALRCRVAISAPSSPPRVLLDLELGRGEPEGWQDVLLSLEPWSGREVTVELAVEAVGGAGLWAGWWAPEIVAGRAGRAPADEGWDLILISLDTLRADHLGSFGYERPTSPNLDAFAAGGVRFATAVSQSPWTRPSHRALFTGVYPLSRGGLHAEPLAAVLWNAGYRTLALTGGGQLDGRFGFDRGFELFRIEDWLRRPASAVERLASESRRRRFLFLHTYEIHDPYDHDRFARDLPRGRLAPGFAKRDWQRWRDDALSDAEKDYVVALYDGGIAYADERLGELFAALAGSGVLERAVVVVTSDHGEQFWEHGSWGHGQNLYDHQLLVPLILHLPPGLRRQLGDGRSDSSLVGRVIEQQVRLVDLYPTILDLLGIPLERSIHGRSLRPLLEGERLAEGAAFAENTNVPRFERKSLRTGRYKLVRSYPKRTAGADGERHVELYDLHADAGERRNLAEERIEVKRALEAELESILGSNGPVEGEEAAPGDLDPDLRRRLEALGYLDD